MNKKTLLVTGGCGFIGSNFVHHIIENTDYQVINLDSLTYAADLKNLSKIENHHRYRFLQGSITNKELVSSIFSQNHIDFVIHFAAESHVDNSITGPEVFLETNVMGTFNLLNTAYKSWMIKPHQYKEEFKNSRFIHISTDEVYGTLGDEGFFTEESPYKPNSPYSASKASSDMIVRSYFHTYGLNSIITNCSNNYGPRQHEEKLIPVIIKNALSQKPIPVYGKGLNTRDWLYVEDHCAAIWEASIKGAPGETYIIGTNNEMKNIDIVNYICEKLDDIKPLQNGSYKDLISFVEDRAGHDWRYAIDATKIKSELGWEAKTSFSQGIEETINWYIEKFTSSLN